VTEKITPENPKEQRGEEKPLNRKPNEESQSRKGHDQPEEPPEQHPDIPEAEE